MKIIVERDDGSTQDVTTLVQIAFDVATHSMDWGSGFLDVEETDGLILLAEACSFPALDEVLQSQWAARMAEGKAWDEMQRLAEKRGAKSWNRVYPAPEEREEFLNHLKRQYAPEGTL